MVGRHSDRNGTDRARGLVGDDEWHEGPAFSDGRTAGQPAAEIVFLGGTLSTARGVAHPFVHQVGAALGCKVACYGLPNAGVDSLLAHKAGLAAARVARVTVIETPGIHGQNNRFYHVHRTRNDRFVSALPSLVALYPDTDFTGINFVGHLRQVLSRENAGAFSRVEKELRSQWARKMAELIGIVGPEVLLLAFHTEDPESPRSALLSLGVTRPMLTSLSVQTGAQVLECILPEPTAVPYSVIPGAVAHDLIATRVQFALQTHFG